MNKEKKYGLFTTICMIIGIVIGSGIFFKSDNILVATNGSIILGVTVFVLAAISIIFGSLSLAQLAKRTDDSGGLIAYANKFSGKRSACVMGWFMLFIYYPSLISVVSWIVGVYVSVLLGLSGTLITNILIGFVSFVFLFAMNALSSKVSGHFQVVTTIIKLMPLFILTIAGLTNGNDLSPSDFATPAFSISSKGGVFMLLLGAIAPIAFSYDGWTIATTISKEVKNSKKNIPLALIIAPSLVLIIYVLYFVGMSMFIGPSKIMEMGDSHVYFAATKIFGDFGSKVIIVFVLASVLGTANGVTLGMLRIIPSLHDKGLIFNKKKYSTKLNLSVCFGITVIWIILNYVTQLTGIMGNSDVSEVPVVCCYALYIVLYIQVIKLYKTGEIKSMWVGVVNPILAIIGSLLILIGGLSNPLFVVYIVLICGLYLYSVKYDRQSSSLIVPEY